MDEVDVQCGVYGEGIVFSVKVARDAKVRVLQDAIVEKKKLVNPRFRVDPDKVTLYLARKQEGDETKWLSGGQNVEDLLRGDVDRTYEKMFSWWKLNRTEYFGDFTLDEDDIHVLVELPVLHSHGVDIGELDPRLVKYKQQSANDGSAGHTSTSLFWSLWSSLSRMERVHSTKKEV